MGLFRLLEATGHRVRYNVRAEQREYWYEAASDRFAGRHPRWAECSDGGDGSGWRPFTEEVEDRVVDVGRRCCFKAVKQSSREYLVPWRMSAEDRRVAVNAILQSEERRVDPFLLWVRGLPFWDGVDRVEGLLSMTLGAAAGALNAWASRTLLCGALERAESPGAVLHQHVVLSGPQGIGKSSVVKGLVPRADWYSTLSLEASDKEVVESLTGRVVVEVDEMTGMRRADIARVKSMLTMEGETVRLAYRRDAVRVPRMWVLAGTSNDQESLPYDTTGNRRFVAVGCPGAMPGREVHEWMAEHRGQLWAEAAQKRAEGRDGWGTGRLPRELDAEQEARNLAFRQMDATLDDRIERLSAEARPLSEIAYLVGLSDQQDAVLSRSDQLRLGGALRLHGWGKSESARPRVWEPPEGWGEPGPQGRLWGDGPDMDDPSSDKELEPF